MKSLFFIAITLLLCITSYAETGWALMKTGEHIFAKQAFAEELQQDPTDEHALLGMIVLSELEQNMLGYESNVKQLLTHHLNEKYLRLFNHVYSPSPSEIIENDRLPNSLKVRSYFSLADSLFKQRAFKASESAYREVLGDYEWSVIGPFNNESGSGHIEVFPIEQEQFLPDKIYPDEAGRAFGWVKREIRNNDGMVVFDDHLPNNFAGTVYFANTFFELPEKQVLQFRLARNTAVKLWVDDRLVFDGKDKRNFNWDQDIIELDLEAGWHRILIKCSSVKLQLDEPTFSFYDTKTFRDLSLIFNEDIPSEFGDGASILNLLDNLGSRFAIRITDRDGNFLQGSRSQFEAPFYNSNVSVRTVSFYPTDDWQVGRVNEGTDLINYYLLTKSYFKYGYLREGEAFLEKITKDIRYIPLVKYLKSKFYYANGKPEKAEATLSGIYQDKSPIFQMFSQKLTDYEKDFEGSTYLSLLNELNKISPSNYRVIKGFINYYRDQNLKSALKKYIQQVVNEFPVYEPYLNSYATTGDNASKRAKNDDDIIDPDEAENALIRIEKVVAPSDYFTVIRYYEQIGEINKVAEYADALIDLYPHRIDYRLYKAKKLAGNGDIDGGIATISRALDIAPYDAMLMEELGDLYYANNNKKEALKWYQLADKYRNSYTYRSSKELDQKINDLLPEGDYTKLLSKASLKDILKDKRYLNQYKYEDAVVVRFDKDVVMLADNEAEVHQLMVIKMQTAIGAGQWKEMDFSFFGEIITHEIIKSNGSKITITKDEGNLLMENLEAGDLIHLKGYYKWPLDRDLKNELAMVNYFGFNAPTFQCNLNIIVPNEQHIEFKTHGIENEYAKNSIKGYDRYQWKMADLPKVAEESALVDESDVYVSISLSTMKDWSKVVKWFDQKTYRKSDPTLETVAIVRSIIRNDMSAEEKIEAVYNFVTKNYRYVPDYLSSNNYIPRGADQTISSKFGDAKDLATLTIALLKQLELDANYVLVRKSRANRSVLLPGLYFDHVIVGTRYDGIDHYLDVTSDYYPYYVLNEQDANAWALPIRDGETDIFKLPDDYTDPEKNLMEIEIIAELTRNDPLTFHVSSKAKGLVSGYFREYLNVASKQEQQQFILDNFGYGVLDDVALVNMELGNLKEISTPLQSDYMLSVNNFLNELSNEYECRIPFMRTILPNPVIFSENREHDLNLERMLQIDPVRQTIKLKLSRGLQLLQLPENINIQNQFGTYELVFKKKGNELLIDKYQVFHRRVINAENFPAFKEFYLEILKADGMKLEFSGT